MFASLESLSTQKTFSVSLVSLYLLTIVDETQWSDINFPTRDLAAAAAQCPPLTPCYIATVSTFDTAFTFAFPPFRHLLKPFRPTHATFRLDPPGAGASVHNLVVNFARDALIC